jgi:SNF2 family DNA or RNA helicase
MLLSRRGPHFHLATSASVVGRVARKIPGMWKDSSGWLGYRDSMAGLLSAVGAGKEAEKLAAWDPPALGIAPAGLHPYQWEAVWKLAGRVDEGALLADDTGLGKSATALSLAKYLGAPKTLIVCPSFVRGVWGSSQHSELKRWWPEAWPPFECKGTKGGHIPAAAKVVVCHYDILYAWVGDINLWAPEFAVFDELHLVGNSISRRAQACKQLEVTRRLGLTATPMTNRPKDLWNPVDTISPNRFGRDWDYFFRYCAPEKVQVSEFKQVWNLDGASHTEELAKRLSFFMVRRTKAEVALELPPFTRQILTNPAGRKDHKAAANIEAVLAGGKLAIRGALGVVGDHKIDWACEVIAGHLAADHSVVCFTYRRELAERICGRLQSDGHDCSYVHGGLDIEARQGVIDVKPQCLIATIDSVGVGVSLAYADVAVFAELDYVPAKLLQAEGRLYRQGQTRTVTIQYLVAEGSVDEWIADAVLGKLGVAASVVGDDGSGLAGALGETSEDEALLRLGKLLLGDDHVG